MKIMIHACPQRMWYVEEFLVPSLIGQGIREDEIEIRNDAEGKGNLISCMESFRDCGEREKDGSGTWHMQDDVIVCRNFAERIRENDSGLVCGFACKNFGSPLQESGRVPMIFLWYSFPCIRIPDSIAGECAEWFFADARHRKTWEVQVTENRHDDWFFRHFVLERHKDGEVLNLRPNLVDHIDYLIGGTTINRLRRIQINRAALFKDADLVEELENRIRERNRHTAEQR